MLLSHGPAASTAPEESRRARNVRLFILFDRRHGIHYRPAPGVPVHWPKRIFRVAERRCAVVKVAAEPIFLAVRQDSRMARADERAIGAQHFGTAAGQEVLATAIARRARDGFAAADANFVRAVHTATAISRIHEQIIVPPVPIDERRFNAVV